MSEMEKFAKFVTEKRTALGLSQADLSVLVFGNKKNKYISDIETGFRKNITLLMMEKILKPLDTNLKYNELKKS